MMAALGKLAKPGIMQSMSPAWRSSLGRLAIAWTILIVLFLPDWANMVSKWSDDATFNHCFMLVPIIAALVWMRRRELAQLTPVGWKPGLIWLGGAALVWFLGALSDVTLFRHAGIVGMLQGAVLTLLGPQVSRGLMFPLFYMIFLVPFGSELVPSLQRLTAQIMMPLLSISGVPAMLDGIFITAPSGYFRVAEACAGANFLIAMIALGALISNLCFTSWRSRIIFMIACVVVPIIANGLRAWGTIMIAEHFGIQYAHGSTHIIYGWIVFAVVMLLLVGGAWRWFDRAIDDPAFDPASLLKPKGKPASNGLLGIVFAVPALVLGWTLLSEQAGARELPNAVAMPDIPGWTRAKATGPTWSPRFDGADHYMIGTYRNAHNEYVDLAIVLYGQQAQGREVAGYGQGAANESLHWSWVGNVAGGPDGVRAERLVGPDKLARIAWTTLVVGGDSMTNGAAVKLQTLKTRLLMGDRRAGAVVVSTMDIANQDANRALVEFRNAMGDPAVLVTKLLDQAEGAQ